MNHRYKIFIYIAIVFLLSCESDEIVQYFEYPDHNVLNIGSNLTDLVISDDSNTLIVADKGNNQVRFIDVSTDNMSIIANVWVGSEPTSLELTADGLYLLVGLQGASSVAVVSVIDTELLGTIILDDDGVYDIEYVNSTDQLILVKQFNDVSGALDYFTAFKVNNTQLKSINTNHQLFLISDKNLAALYLEKNLEEYLLFFEKNYLE